MEHTLAVLCGILGGVLVLRPVLFEVLLLTMPGVDWERHPRNFLVTALLAAAFRVWYTPPASFTVGSVLAYGVTTLAHASRPATLIALSIVLLCSLLLWRRHLVWILHERRRRGRPPNEIVC
jgi:hypothetical protein